MIADLINLLEKYWLNHGDEHVPKNYIDGLILRLTETQRTNDETRLSADDRHTLYWVFRDEPAPDELKEFWEAFYDNLCDRT